MIISQVKLYNNYTKPLSAKEIEIFLKNLLLFKRLNTFSDMFPLNLLSILKK